MKTTGFAVKTTGLPGAWKCGVEGPGVPWNWSCAGARVGKGLVVVLEVVVLTVLAAGVGLRTGDTPRVGKGLVVALAVVLLGVVRLVVLAVVVVLLVVVVRLVVI